MKSLLTVPAQLAQPHALPFRVIFEEHRRRKPALLDQCCREVLSFADDDKEGEPLTLAIRRQEAAYAALAATSRQIEAGAYTGTTDALLLECAEADRPLKYVLHRLNASALCLSGGGIRSASFSLGVLEGLARFSRPVETNCKEATAGEAPSEDDTSQLNSDFGVYPGSPAPPTLMDGLDYLSTVSGGGYTGSWLMSWVYRRMKAIRPFAEVAESFGIAQGMLRNARSFAWQAAAAMEGAASAVSDEAAVTLSQQDTCLLRDLLCACTDAQESVLLALRDAEAVASRKQASDGDRSYGVVVGTATEALRLVESCMSLLAAVKIRLRRPLLPNPLREIAETIATKLHAAVLLLKSHRAPAWQIAYCEVVSALAGQSRVTAGDPEPAPIRHLRSYTSYLAPSLGFTVDTFDLAAIVLRNLLITWLMLLPIILACIALAETSAFALRATHQLLSSLSGAANARFTVLVTALYLVAAGVVAFTLPSHKSKAISRVLRPYSLPLFLLALLGSAWLLTAASLPYQPMVHWSPLLSGWSSLASARQWPPLVRQILATTPMALLAYMALAVSILLSFRRRLNESVLSGDRPLTKAIVLCVIAIAAAGGLTSVLLAATQRVAFRLFLQAPLASSTLHLPQDGLFVVFGVPLFLTVVLIGTSIFCAILGLLELEEDREWWSRAGGCLLILNLAWIVVHGVALYSQSFGSLLWSVIIGMTGLAVGALASAVGFSGVTGTGAQPVKAAQMGGVGRFLEKHNLLLPSASFVAILLIVIGATSIEESLRARLLHSGTVQDAWHSALLLFAIFAALALALNWAININLFSLHGMYRMRLMRAFLGASNFNRSPNAFTNFDPDDTPHEVDLPSAFGAPLHLVNATLNLVGTHKTAWRQRKAECFSFSPVACGSWRLGYVPASMYGGVRGVSVASAMAISGAAFNPNMGYHSSPLLTLLMTFFNVRLGCWLPNPSADRPFFERFYSKPGPTFALYPLIKEALGMTGDTSAWIELSDGGHFENLGLYEMVMRRVKHIIVVDAGADPNYQFEDLGNAIRKIQIDLGIPIDFCGTIPMVSGMAKKNFYCTTATIRYECVDSELFGLSGAERNGQLVYIKATLTDKEPPDIFQYAKTHATFPNETTANQFFNETQFESYRHLGSNAITAIMDKAPSGCWDRSMEAFIEAVKRYRQDAPAPSPQRQPPAPVGAVAV